MTKKVLDRMILVQRSERERLEDWATGEMRNTKEFPAFSLNKLEAIVIIYLHVIEATFRDLMEVLIWQSPGKPH